MRKTLWLVAVLVVSIVCAWAVIRGLSGASATIYESDDWLVMTMPGQNGHCVLMDHLGAPIPDFPLETNSDSGAVLRKTDAAGRGKFVSFSPQSAVVLLPTGHKVNFSTCTGLTVMIQKQP